MDLSALLDRTPETFLCKKFPLFQLLRFTIFSQTQKFGNSFKLQGDHSACAKPAVDFKTKVLLWPGLAWAGQAKAKLLFGSQQEVWSYSYLNGHPVDEPKEKICDRLEIFCGILWDSDCRCTGGGGITVKFHDFSLGTVSPWSVFSCCGLLHFSSTLQPSPENRLDVILVTLLLIGVMWIISVNPLKLVKNCYEDGASKLCSVGGNCKIGLKSIAH